MENNSQQLFKHLQGQPFVIAGPCVIESENLCLQIARHMAKVCSDLGFFYIFKASFDKANRSSIHSFRGPGIKRGLEILATVKQQVQVPILTDIHEPHQAALCQPVVDILQIPALLCRQTDLLVAAGKTGQVVNLKKGQFLDGSNMQNLTEKVASTNNQLILLTERGSSFGNQDLVVDFRNILKMQQLGYPVIFDATHSTQTPTSLGKASGGQREYAPALAFAAAAMGVNGWFFEVHPTPEKALCDAPCVLPLEQMEKVLTKIKHIIKN